MTLFRPTCFALTLLAVSFAPARAAVLLHEYALRGSLNDNKGGSPLTSMGGQITALGYVFAANQGLLLSSSSLSQIDYSIELSFRFDVVDGYRKIADFHDRTQDTGLYVLNGALNFYPIVTASVSDFSPGVDVHVVLTREAATNTVTGYVNGQQRFSFIDANANAVITGANNTLTLLADDNVQVVESSGGTANYVRVYNGALTASEVAAVYAAGAPLAVPEPSTLALLVMGSVVIGGEFLRRRRGGLRPAVDDR